MLPVAVPMRWVSVVLAAGLAGSAGGCREQPVGGSDALALSPAAPEPPPERAPRGEMRLRAVYVPAYSQLPLGTQESKPALLSILLSVRNMDSTSVVTLTHVDYFDTSGHRVRRYLESPRPLRPLETAEFAVDTYDRSGGSGANFLVYWEGPSDAHSLLTEAVMLGHLGSGHVAFTSRGVELDRRPEAVGAVLGEASETDSGVGGGAAEGP